MSTSISDQQVTNICADLTRTIAMAIKAGNFPSEQLSPACKEIHTLLDTAKTLEDVIFQLSDMASRNPLFGPILDSLQKQQKAGSHVEHMFQRNIPRANAE